MKPIRVTSLLSLAIAVAGITAAVGQNIPTEGQPAPSNAPNAQYPRINADRSVTFRIRADDAKSVRITTLGPYDLVKGDDGFWTVTTKPLEPGFYYYAVVVDGVEKAGIKHVWVETDGAHVWTVWRKYLVDFGSRLF